MLRPYRTLKIKVPRPCCPWWQIHSDRIEQQLQAMENQLQELSARLATAREAENDSAGFLAALQLLGLSSSPRPTGENPQTQALHLIGAISAIIAALDRLAPTSDGPAPANLVTPSPKTLSPHQLTQIAAPRNESGHPVA